MHPTQQLPKARPFIKWVGGKGKLLPQYRDLIPDFRFYYEPFLGGGAMFFDLQPRFAFLSDINQQLIHTYRCVRDNPTQLLHLLNKMAKSHSEQYFYQIRDQTPETEIFKIAARFIYLNKTCFNGLWRENKKGQNNVPIGDNPTPNICDPETIIAASKVLQNVQIRCGDYRDCAKYIISSNAFFFFDPPYVPIKKGGFTSYSKGGFNFENQKELKELFDYLSASGAKLMLANADCTSTRFLYKNYRITEIKANRSINSDATKRGKVGELIITNY